MFEGCSWPDRVGAAPKLGRTICGVGGQTEDNEWDLQSPPAAIEVCPSDQLQPSLKPSLDFDLQEGVNNRKKRNSGRKRGVNSTKSDSFELLVCE